MDNSIVVMSIVMTVRTKFDNCNNNDEYCDIFFEKNEKISPDENKTTAHAESPLDEVGAVLEEVGDGSCRKVLWVTFDIEVI